MRKFLLASVVMGLFAISFVTPVKAGTYNVPQGAGTPLPTADYGGVERSTISFSSANVVVFTGAGSFAGVIASSAPSSVTLDNAFIDCRDTSTLVAGASNGGNPGVGTDDYLTTDRFVRLYIGVSLSTGTGAPIANPVMLPKPIRVYNGLVCKASSALYNMITFLGTKFTR